MEACRRGYIEIAKILLDHGADSSINWKESVRGQIALTEACKNDCIDIAKLLVDRGADIDSPFSTQHTCLLFSCLGGRLSKVEFLLNMGPNI